MVTLSAVIVVLTLALLALVLHYFLVRPLLIWLTFYRQSVPCAPFIPFVGQGLAILQTFAQNDAAAFLRRYTGRHGHCFALCIGHIPVLVVSDYATVHSVVKHHHGHYQKGSMSSACMRPIVGDHGVVVEEEPVHNPQRKMIAPAFHHSNLLSMTPIMIDLAYQHTQAIIDRIRGSDTGSGSSGNSMILDMKHELTDLTLTVIASCAFGASLNDIPEARSLIHRAFTTVLNAILQRNLTFVSQIPIIDRLPIMGRRTITDTMRSVTALVNRIISDRKRSASASLCHGKDLLDHVIDAYQHDNERIRDESLTFIIAGHETSASMLSFLVSELVQHPSLMAECVREIDIVAGDEERLTVDHLSRLPLIEAVINETLRCYPAAPMLFRQCHTPHTLHCHDLDDKGINIPVGAYVVSDIYTLHRRSDYWGPTADQWDPYRWIPSHPRFHPPTSSSAFAPFSVGPRSCMGAKFAMNEAKVIVAVLLSQLRLECVAQVIEREIKITYTPKRVLVKVAPR